MLESRECPRQPEDRPCGATCAGTLRARPLPWDIRRCTRWSSVSDPAADRLPQAWLAAAMGRLPDGVAVFDADWTICYANPAAARLLSARTAELAGRNLWIALPEVAGSVFPSFLLHARTVGTPVTWRGFYAPAGRWLSATAELVDDLLQVCFREAADLPTEGSGDAAASHVAVSGANADRDRLRFLAEVS